MVPEITRQRGPTRARPIRSKPYRDMTGSEFALAVLGTFDLDMARHCIFKDQYLSISGGIDTLRAFFDDGELSNLNVDGLVWSHRSWRGLSEGEKHHKRMETKQRVKKYVSR